MQKINQIVTTFFCCLAIVGFNLACGSSSKGPGSKEPGWSNGSYLFQGQIVETTLYPFRYPYADQDSSGNLTSLVPLTQWSLGVTTRSAGSSSWALGPTISQSNGLSISTPSLVVFPSGAALACWYQENTGVMSVSRSSSGIWSSPLLVGPSALGYRLVKGPGDFAGIIWESADSSYSIWSLNVGVYSPAIGWSAMGQVPKEPNRAQGYALGVDSGGNTVAAWGYVTPAGINAIFASAITYSTAAWEPPVQLNGPPTPGAAGLFPIIAVNPLGVAMVAWNQYSINGSPTTVYGTWYCTHSLTQGWSIPKQGPTGFTSSLLFDKDGKALSAGKTPNPFLGNANFKIQTSYFNGITWRSIPVIVDGQYSSDDPNIAEDTAGNFYLAFTNPPIQYIGQKSVYATRLSAESGYSGWEKVTVLTGPNANYAKNATILGVPGLGIKVIWTNDQSVFYTEQGISVSAWE